MTTAIQRVPKLRFPEFSGEWDVDSIKELGFVISDGNYGELYPTSNQFISEGVPFIRANNLKRGQVIWNDMRYISEDLHEVLTSGHLETNDVLVTTRGNIGLVALVDKKFEGANINAQLCLIRNSRTCDQLFLFYYLSKSTSKKQFIMLTTGTALKQLPRKNLQKVVVGYSTLPEQKKIASFLSEVDSKIEFLSKKKSLLEQYKKGMMQKLFSQEIRFKDNQGNEFPEWKEKRLEDVSKINPKSREVPEEFLYIDLESVSQGKLSAPKHECRDTAPSRAQRLLQAEDILFQLVRPYQRNNYFFPGGETHVASTGYAVLRAKCYPQFLYQAVHEERFVNRVLEKCTGTNYPAINSNDLASVLLPIPHPKEQQKIADFLSSLDRKIELVGDELEKAQIFKKGLLQQMFV